MSPSPDPARADADHADRPAIGFPPPFVYLGFLLLGFVLDRLAGFTRFDLRIWDEAFGIALAVAGLIVVVVALRYFRREGEDPEPWTPSANMLAEGLYRFSRNPMYLGVTLLYLGIAVFFGSPGALLLLPLAIASIHYFVIAREEVYLARRFGEAYRDYCKRVRRWI